ncbi:sensor histidine kinase [Thermodesulfobacteriota bacterium]
MDKTAAKKTVLLVDDEVDIRDVLKISLTDSGYKVLTAENGIEALRLFREAQPPVVLTDIKMPDMDGIELLRKIKYENPETEVVMITGHGDMDLAIESLKHEATDFITKPINVDALEIALKRAYEKIVIREKLREYTENLEQLVREKTELQDRLSSLGFMIGSISHGIKGLLTGLEGGMYILESGLSKKDQEKVLEGFEAIKLVSGRIKKMILDILYYAKERELSIEPKNILSFAHDVTAVVEPKLLGRKIQLIPEFDEAPDEFQIDADFLRSALINILDNAVDACIEDRRKKSHKIIFRIKQDKNNVVIEIYDDGIGMDAETKENIFKLFFSSKKGKGTGFGLYIANNIIKQHGGTISVNSAKGKGTHFNIKIPKISQSEKIDLI